MKTPIHILAIGLAALLPMQSSGSENYQLSPTSVDAGGAASGSATYSNDGTVGGIAGISTVAAPVGIAKAGYVGQLYEVVGLQLVASPTNVDETATSQLSARELLDDDSTLAIAPSSVSWGVVGGPLVGVDGGGLVTADVVYEDTPATVEAGVSGVTNQIGLMVLDVDPDNFGSYAGDELDDDWQTLHFGLNNPDAGPLVDADGDMQDNTFEFVAGLIPTNSMSRFQLMIENSGLNEKNIIFSPRFMDRDYAVSYKNDLATGSWDPLPSSSISDVTTERTVTDTSATDDRRNYRVEITKP